MAYIIPLLLLAVLGYIAYQKFVARKATNEAQAATPNPGTNVPNSGTPPQVATAGVGTPTHGQAMTSNDNPMLDAYLRSGSGQTPLPPNTAPVKDRSGKVLEVPGDWRYVGAKNAEFSVPNAHGPLQIQVAGGDGDIALKVYSQGAYVVGGVYPNVATVNLIADGDYRVTVDLAHPTGLETINRFGA